MIRQLGSLTLKNNSVLSIVAGSVLEFEGDAIVNAANTGGISGGMYINIIFHKILFLGGIDGMINKMAGSGIITERQNFGGIQTGK